jgi:hypothetical protein
VKEEVPVEVKEEVPVEVKEEVPVEVKEEVPVEVKEEVPVEVKEEVPVEVKEEVPVELAEMNDSIRFTLCRSLKSHVGLIRILFILALQNVVNAVMMDLFRSEFMVYDHSTLQTL